MAEPRAGIIIHLQGIVNQAEIVRLMAVRAKKNEEHGDRISHREAGIIREEINKLETLMTRFEKNAETLLRWRYGRSRL